MLDDDGSKNTDDSGSKSQNETDNVPQPEEVVPSSEQTLVEAEPSANSVESDEDREEPVEDNVVQLDPAAAMKSQVNDLAAKLRTVSKAYTDLQDEMDSFRQRQMQLADVKAQKRAGEVVVAFFEPVQNLKRCLETAGDDAESIKQGLEMVVGQFGTQMEQLGLREVPGIGSRFDPNVHNALALAPVKEKEKDGIVLMVHAAGYAVGTRVIQPAQVIIGKFEESQTEA